MTSEANENQLKSFISIVQCWLTKYEGKQYFLKIPLKLHCHVSFVTCPVISNLFRKFDKCNLTPQKSFL